MALWNRAVSGAALSAASAFAQLEQLYGEPHRHYHTLDHIRYCLDQFDQAAVWAHNPDAVEMALWFHDAIYVAGAKDNEWHSASVFREWSEGAADSSLREQVHGLVMMTTHRETPGRPDERLIVDIDLSSFGLPWEQFERDGQHIRAECVDCTDEDYFSGHLQFLLSLLSRPTFYFTAHFQQRYEQIARTNAQRVIDHLRARGYGGAC